MVQGVFEGCKKEYESISWDMNFINTFILFKKEND